MTNNSKINNGQKGAVAADGQAERCKQSCSQQQTELKMVLVAKS